MAKRATAAEASSTSILFMQDLVCAADEDEAMRSYRRALENSMSGASAAHPYELIGEEKMSLAKVRLMRQVSY